jgi:hypothetical protein
MTISDIDFMRSQGKASAWPVLAFEAALGNILNPNLHCNSLILLQHNMSSHLPQVERSAVEALLRKLPDVVVDFTSAVPVTFQKNSFHA